MPVSTLLHTILLAIILFQGIFISLQFIIFKAFQKGKAWKELSAIVISEISWFDSNFIEATDLLGYISVIENHSLQRAFEGSTPDSGEVFFPKERIVSFNQTINANSLARQIRGIVLRYFGPIDVDNSEFVDKCYVHERAHDKNVSGVRTLIRDSVSPFMKNYGVNETEDAESGGAFANRLVNGMRQGHKGDIVILFGGKGAGKSTFIKKVLYFRPPPYLKKYCVPVVIDMLSAPKDAISVRKSLWESLIDQLDSDRLLIADRAQLLRLFSDKFDVAEKQSLAGLNKESEAYNLTLNQLLKEWKSDDKYVAQRLVAWHRNNNKGVIVAVDNTDQLDNELQDYTFSLAAEIIEALGCVVLISMREERFYASKIRGFLDAYQNSAFHISSPTPDEVFGKRINYVLELLRDSVLNVEEGSLESVASFFRVFRNDFSRSPPSPLNQFITASAHGNIRLALDLFGDLILSGYTNAQEMAQSGGRWTLLIHQVIKPLMTPTRLFYDEKNSKIPNLFQIRTNEGGSHFTGLRILKRLSVAQDPLSPAFIPMPELRGFFADVFGFDGDFRYWIDRLLASNLIESSTRHDSFADEIDALRITSFGQFALDELYKAFTYIDLICTDSGMRSESHCNALVNLANGEVQLFRDGRRFDRVKLRLDKMDLFLSYLSQEEQREIAYYDLPPEYEFVPAMFVDWESQKVRVIASASKNQ